MVDLQQKERDFAEWKQSVWDQWWDGTGHCGECPIRCENHGSKPGYGAFNPDADVMIIGREPGAKTRFLADEASGKPRKYRTVPEKEVKLPPRNRHEYPYSHKVLAEWNFYWRGPANLFRTSISDNSDREFVNRHPRESYYTNALKCTRLPNKSKHLQYEEISNPDDLNDKARNHCQGHLKEEIALVSPDVIVTFGAEAFSHTMGALGRELNDKSLKSWINDTNDSSLLATHGENPSVIPAYHWSGAHFVNNMRNAVAVSNRDNTDECWSVIAKTVNSVLEK